MAIALSTLGTRVAASTPATSISFPYPVTLAAGDLLVMFMVTKYPPNSPVTPSGWIAFTGYQASGGAGASGAGTGNVYATAFVKVSDGTETGSLTVDITGANVTFGRMYRFTKSATKRWGLLFTTGSDNSAGTAWSVTGAANINIQTGDALASVSAVCSVIASLDSAAYSAAGVSSLPISNNSVFSSTAADDISYMIEIATSITGLSTGAPSLTGTLNGTGSATGAGATVFIRMREEPEAIIGSTSLVTSSPQEIALAAVQSLSLVSLDPKEVVNATITTESDVTGVVLHQFELEITGISSVEALVEQLTQAIIATSTQVAADLRLVPVNSALPLRVSVFLNLPNISLSINQKNIEIEVSNGG
jgi:hypothetical protein